MNESTKWDLIQSTCKPHWTEPASVLDNLYKKLSQKEKEEASFVI